MDRLQQRAEQLRGVPSEQRETAVWQQCADDVLTRSVVGAALGVGTAIVLLPATRVYARGLVTGIMTGVAAGRGYETCNDRFIALQSLGSVPPK